MLVIVAALALLFLATQLFVGGGEEEADSSDPGVEAPSPGASSDVFKDIGTGEGKGQGKAETPTMEIAYVFDVADPRKLAGYSDAVFVGRVEEVVGEEPLTSTIPDSPGQPQTQFSVEVGKILKGEDTDRGVSRGESVTVNQRGGTDPETGKEVVVVAAVPAEPSAENEDHSAAAAEEAIQAGLLEPGGTYLFSTRYNEREDWQGISGQPYGTRPLDGGLEDERVLDEYREAVENQVNPLP